MDEKIVNYIRTQLSRNLARLRSYVFPTPGSNWKYPGRHAYIKISKYISDILTSKKNVSSRWVIIPGISGTGKTTILAQIYYNYVKKVEPNHILYISLDEVVNVLGSTLKDVLENYERILGKSFESTETPIILLIDEVHRDPEWASVIASVYNRSTKIIVICSGSSAVSLQMNTSDLGRRAIFEKLYPLSFGEFIMIKKNKFPNTGLKAGIKDALYNSKTAKEVYEKLKPLEKQVQAYWADIEKLNVDEFLSTGTLPYAVGNSDRARVLQGIDVLLDKIINTDIRELGRLDTDTLNSIKRVLYILAESDQVSVNNTSQTLGISSITLSTVLDILAKAELIIKVSPHGSNTSTARKPAKYLFMSPAVRMTLLDVTGIESTFLTRKGKLFEDVVGLHFYREFISTGRGSLTFDSAEKGADFILRIENKRQIAIEVGLGIKNSRQVESTMQKVNCDFGVIVCDCTLSKVEEKEIIMLPIEYFLCI